MIIKVCGITEEENYAGIDELSVEMIGINFYKPSSRYIANRRLKRISEEIRVGVYVNASMETLKNTVKEYDLDMLQLHGDESVAYCKEAQSIRPIIKVWRIDQAFDWSSMEAFGFADCFLFDTKTALYGGSGHKFDWTFLDNYKVQVPFLLSGGIGPDDSDAIRSLDHPQFKGIDINSKFEDQPGLKNIDTIKMFVSQIRK